MSEVGLYIKISRKCPRPGPGMYIAILEATTASGKTGTLTLKKHLEDITPHQLELTAIVDALHRCKGDLDLQIHSDHDWFRKVKQNGWFEKWQQAGWMNKDKPRPGADLYQELWTLENVCSVRFDTFDQDLGTYKTWMENEIGKEMG